jgi:hypothetical protein
MFVLAFKKYGWNPYNNWYLWAKWDPQLPGWRNPKWR